MCYLSCGALAFSLSLCHLKKKPKALLLRKVTQDKITSQVLKGKIYCRSCAAVKQNCPLPLVRRIRDQNHLLLYASLVVYRWRQQQANRVKPRHSFTQAEMHFEK